MKRMSHSRISHKNKLPEKQKEECRQQDTEHHHWLEKEIAQVFERYDAQEGEYLTNDEVERRMSI